jgi:uncharacterized membrane protein YccC
VRSVRETGLGVSDWLTEAVPDWLVEVVRPKKAPVPWGTMARSVLALWAPMVVAFATGRRELALLPAMGALLSVSIDNGGPYWSRVERIGTAALLGGAPGLFIGTLIHGRGWIAVIAVVAVAAVSAIITRLGGIGSVTGLQLFVYSALGLGPLGLLRPWWHTALEFLAGVVWSLLLITPGYLLAPRAAERKAVAAVFHAIAANLRALGTPALAQTNQAETAALNVAYEGMLAKRASASGRSRRDAHLLAVLNVSHQFVEAGAALRVTGETVPPLVADTVDRLGDAVLDTRGPGSGVVGAGLFGWRGTGAALPVIPPVWSTSPGALGLRDAMVSMVRVMAGSWAPPAGAAREPAAARLRRRLARAGEQLIGGRMAWEFTVRLMLCTGVAAILSEVLPIQRSYWLVLTTGIILKPDYGSVFDRAVQRAVGTIIGAVLGAVLLAIVPYGPWLLLPFGVLAALLPYGKSRSFGLTATFLTPLVVLLIDLLSPAGWHLAATRALDTLLAAAVVLVVGYLPWPSAWQAHLPGQFAETLRAVSAYMDDALVAMPAARIAEKGSARASSRAPGAQPPTRSRLRRGAFQSLSNLRVEFQRTMSEPAPISRRATAWWPAVVALDEVLDSVTSTVLAIGQGSAVPSAAAVHALTGKLRTVADSIEAGVPPRVGGALPADPELAAVTDAVRTVLSVLVRGGGEGEAARAAGESPAAAPAT